MVNIQNKDTSKVFSERRHQYLSIDTLYVYIKLIFIEIWIVKVKIAHNSSPVRKELISISLSFTRTGSKNRTSKN